MKDASKAVFDRSSCERRTRIGHRDEVFAGLILALHCADEVEEGKAGRLEAGALPEFLSDDDHPVEILKVSNDAEEQQRQRLARVRAERDTELVERRLEALRQAAESDHNVIGPMLDCARAYATLYEIRHALERVWGAYREPVFF